MKTVPQPTFAPGPWATHSPPSSAIALSHPFTSPAAGAELLGSHSADHQRRQVFVNLG